MWYIYVVECNDHSLYCGITKCLDARVKKHNSGKGAKYTRSRRPVALVCYTSVSESRSDALKAEYAFKQLSRDRKLFYVSKGLDLFLEKNSEVHEYN